MPPRGIEPLLRDPESRVLSVERGRHQLGLLDGLECTTGGNESPRFILHIFFCGKHFFANQTPLFLRVDAENSWVYTLSVSRNEVDPRIEWCPKAPKLSPHLRLPRSTSQQTPYFTLRPTLHRPGPFFIALFCKRARILVQVERDSSTVGLGTTTTLPSLNNY